MSALVNSNSRIPPCFKACVLYIVRVGITDQMSEPIQRGFSVFLAKQVFLHGPTGIDILLLAVSSQLTW